MPNNEMPKSPSYEELNGYRVAVEENAQRGKDEILPNRGPEHAIIICSAIFRHASQRVCILANNLCNDDVSCTSEYMLAMDSFLDKKNAKLQIILTDFDEKCYESHPEFLASLFVHPDFHEKVEIKKLSKQDLPILKSTNKPFHFCVADERMYRIETDTESRTAQCNFGDKEIGQRLTCIFDKRFEQAQPLQIEDLIGN